MYVAVLGEVKDETTGFEKYENKYVVYVLELEDGCYYIGRSKHLQSRLKKHKNGNSVYFVGRHKMLRLEKVFAYENEECDLFDEEAVFFKYCKMYGIDKCRGGRLSGILLNGQDTKTVEDMLKNSSDNCFLCQSPSHWWKSCPLIQCNNPYCKQFGHIESQCPLTTCRKCGGKSHWASACNSV